MNILITGGTGFIGHLLVDALLKENHFITVLSRQAPNEVRTQLTCKIRPIQSLNQLSSQCCFDAVINLAGEPIMKKTWSNDRKKVLLSSRVQFTHDLVDKILSFQKKPSVFINGSAVGYYGSHDAKNPQQESSQNGNDFSALLCHQWEQAARKIESHDVRLCITRIGVVLGINDGFLREILPLVYAFLGGIIGNGKQIISWIHVQDLINSILFLLKNESESGAFNCTALNPVSNKIFMKTLGKAVSRPIFMRYPSLLFKLLLGESSSLLLKGQAALPKRLQESGFKWQYPDLQPALEQLLQEKH